MSADRSLVPIVTSFVAGMATMVVANKIFGHKPDRTNAGATSEGNDLSLFYGDVKALTTITDSHRFLPSEIYGKIVRDCVVCCVDCLIVRTTESGKKECLLVERSSEPVKGVWWLPGGRLLSAR